MSEEEIFQLASETEDTTNQRTKCMESLAVLQDGLHDLRSLEEHRLSTQRCSPGADGLYRDTKPRDDSTAEKIASQTEGTSVKSLAEVIEEHSPTPESGHEANEEIPLVVDPVADTSDP